MAVAKAKAAPRTASREAPPEAVEARMPERDPAAIYTRDGRRVDLGALRRQLRGDDRFDLHRWGIVAPAGWCYEWRTRTVKNVEARDFIVDDEQAGWTPVPADRHAGKIMPDGHKGPIEMGGLMLMERDVRLMQMSRLAQEAAANALLNTARSSQGMRQILNQAAPNSGAITDFAHGAAENASGVKITREARPQEGNYTYTLDE